MKPSHELIEQTVKELCRELNTAITNWPPFNSAHEGYGVLAEEVDELWAHVKMNQKNVI